MTEPKNPYIAGNPVGGSPAFVGREAILRSVLRMLESPGENAIVLYGQRRIGKTSVLQELAQRLRTDGPYHPVYFDLQDKAALPLAQVVQELAQRLAAELVLPAPPDWGAAAPETFRKEYLLSALKKLPEGHSLVVLFDEFDVLDAPAENQAGAAFFPYLRDLLAASPRVQFVFVIGRRPEDLSNLTLSVFKGVRSEQISLLTPEETGRLVRLSEADGSLAWTQAAVDAVYALTGGHPFLTQQLCQEVWEQTYETRAGPEGQGVAPSSVESAVPATLRGATNALEWLWGGLAPAERIVASALAGAGSGAITQEELERQLQESGVRILVGELRDAPAMLQRWDLIEPQNGAYRFRVELLRRWIAERKPLSRVQQEIDYIQPAAESLFRAAYALYQGGQLQETLPLLQQVIRLNPNHQRGTQLLAEILLTQNRLDEAQQLLENLYETSPAVARPRLVQTLLLQAQTNVPEDKLLELYDRVLALEKGQPEAVAGRRRVWEARGDKAVKSGDTLAAMEAYRETSNRDKWLEAALLRIASLERDEQFEMALAQAKVVWEAYPNEKTRLPDLDLLQRKTQLAELYNQGLAALKANKKDEAAKLLAQVVGISPSYKEATRYLHQAITSEDVKALRDQLQKTTKERDAAQRSKQMSEEQLAKMQELLNRIEAIETTAPAQTPAAPTAETRPRLPDLFPYDDVPSSTKATKTPEDQPVRELRAWNPIDHLRLLGWLFFAPGRLKAHQRKWGEAIWRIGKWPASILTWLPLLITCFALGLGALPRVSGSPPSTLYLGFGVALAVATTLAGWFGDHHETSFLVEFNIATGMAIVITSILVIGMALNVMGGVALSVAITIAGTVAGIIAGRMTGGTFKVAFNVASGVAAGMAGGAAIGVATGVTAGVVTGVGTGVAASVAIGVAAGLRHKVPAGVFILILFGIPILAAGTASGLMTGSFSSGLIRGVAFGAAIIVTLLVTSGAEDVIGRIVEEGERSPLVMSCVAVLLAAYAFLIWLSFLGGWRVFAR